MPDAVLIVFPMKVATGWGSKTDLLLTRNPPASSWETVPRTCVLRASSDEEMRAASSRYWRVCAEGVGAASPDAAKVRWRWTTRWASPGACVHPKGTHSKV